MARNDETSEHEKSCESERLVDLGLVAGAEGGPGTGLHVAKIGLLPSVIGMRGEERLGQEIGATGVADAGDQAHVFGHIRIGGFALDGASRVEGLPSPDGDAAFGRVNVATKHAFIRFGLFLEGVKVIGQHLLRQIDVDFALVFVEELFPPGAARVR